jgi:hypothetical protein
MYMCANVLPEVKGRVADHLPSVSAMVKNMWSFATIPLYTFHGVHKKGFTYWKLLGLIYYKIKYLLNLFRATVLRTRGCTLVRDRRCYPSTRKLSRLPQT